MGCRTRESKSNFTNQQVVYAGEEDNGKQAFDKAAPAGSLGSMIFDNLKKTGASFFSKLPFMNQPNNKVNKVDGDKTDEEVTTEASAEKSKDEEPEESVDEKSDDDVEAEAEAPKDESSDASTEPSSDESKDGEEKKDEKDEKEEKEEKEEKSD